MGCVLRDRVLHKDLLFLLSFVGITGIMLQRFSNYIVFVKLNTTSSTIKSLY